MSERVHRHWYGLDDDGWANLGENTGHAPVKMGNMGIMANSTESMPPPTSTPKADSDSILYARRTFAKAFEQDPGFRLTYVANVAMLLSDHYGITDFETRNKAGSDIVHLLFEGNP